MGKGLGVGWLIVAHGSMSVGTGRKGSGGWNRGEGIWGGMGRNWRLGLGVGVHSNEGRWNYNLATDWVGCDTIGFSLGGRACTRVMVGRQAGRQADRRVVWCSCSAGPGRPAGLWCLLFGAGFYLNFDVSFYFGRLGLWFFLGAVLLPVSPVCQWGYCDGICSFFLFTWIYGFSTR
jgi:hypothetical protein